METTTENKSVETENPVAENTTNTFGPVTQDEAEAAVETVDFESLTDDQKIEVLSEERGGHFDVPSLSIEDLKFLRSRLQGEQEFSGPQQAFQLINAFFGLEKAVATYTNVFKEAKKNNSEVPVISLPASTIESAIFFTGNIKGKGVEQARQLVKLAVALNVPATNMRQLDDQIKALQEKVKLNAPVADQTNQPTGPAIEVEA